MQLQARTRAAKSGALALALLLTSAPLAHADNSNNAPVRRGAPPPPTVPGQNLPLHEGRARMGNQPPPMAKSQPPQLNQGPARQTYQAPPTRATPYQRASSAQPLSSLPTVPRASAPLNTPAGQGQANGAQGRGGVTQGGMVQGGAVQGGRNPIQVPNTPQAPNRAFEPRRTSLGAGQNQPGGTPAFGGGRGYLNGGPAPLRLPSPLGGTNSSPSLDSRRGASNAAPANTRPLNSYPALNNPAASQPRVRQPYNVQPDNRAQNDDAQNSRGQNLGGRNLTGQNPGGQNLGGQNSNAAALAALRARAAGQNAPAPRLVAPTGRSDPAGVHYGGARRGGPVAAPAAGLPTHTGGVRVEPRRGRSWTRHGRQVWTPDWGYAPAYPPTYVTHVEVVNHFGFCPHPYPDPVYWPEPVPSYVEYGPEYAYPALPLFEPETPALVAPPAPAPWPEPLPVAPEGAPAQPAAPAEPSAEAQAARAEAFGRAFEAFQRAAYEDALAGFDAIARADAKDGEAWMAIAHAAFALGRYTLAAEAVAQAAALGGFPRGYRFDPAPLYTGDGTFDALLERVARHVATTPRDADARLVLAWLLTSLGRRVEAQEQLQQILLLRPADATAPVLTIALLPALPPAEAGPSTQPAAPLPSTPLPAPAR